MWRAAMVACLALAACGDDAPTTPKDAAVPNDAAPARVAPCLDPQSELAAPPSDQLPCDLISPEYKP